MNLTVVYDACVLYPAPLRSLLMYLAMTGLYRARWTNDIRSIPTTSSRSNSTLLPISSARRPNENVKA